MLSALTLMQHPGATALATVVIAAVLWAAWQRLLEFLRPKHPDRTGNGIAAGPIKVYDNRFLSIRLDELKLGVIDPEKLDVDVGTTQGNVASNSEVGVNTGADVPKPDDKNKSEAKESRTSDAPGVKLSQSARSRLAEQINLRYELVGLRMILERSLTDRLWGEGDAKNARLQAVLGLQVSLDPPAHCKGCAAVVEVTLTSPSGEPVSLVALLPQERTNNTVFVNTRSGSASGAGAIEGRPFGLFWKRTRASTGLLAEPETVAFQRPPEPEPQGDPKPHHEAKPLTVGWQFRPPLECPAVTPGLRQVFAIVALPSIDGSPANQKPVALQASVRTYWRRFDPKTGTTSPRWGLIPWRLASEERKEMPQIVDVAFTQDTQERLKPDVTQITTKQLGPETVLVMVDGKDFFPGTTVAIGSKVHRDGATGLMIKSDNHFQITTTPEELVYGEGVINGRYGPTVKLLIPPEVSGIEIARWYVARSSGVKFEWLKIFISSTDKSTPLKISILAHLPDPIVMVGDYAVPPPYFLWDTTSPVDSKLPCVLLQAMVPAEWNTETSLMRLTFPFCGKPYQLAFGIENTSPNWSFSVVRWAQDHTQSFLITTADEQFDNVGRWCVELGDRVYPLLESTPTDFTPPDAGPSLVRLSKAQIRLTVPAEAALKYQILVIHYQDGTGKWVFPLQVPPLLAALEKPTLENDVFEVVSKTPNFVRIKGKLLDCVDKVTFTPPEPAKPEDAKFSRSPDNSSITVFIPGGQKPGFGKLVAQDKNQATIGEVTIIVKD